MPTQRYAPEENAETTITVPWKLGWKAITTSEHGNKLSVFRARPALKALRSHGTR